MMDRTQTLKWSTSAGPVILQWPSELPPEEAKDALDAVKLACRAIERLSSVRPTFDEYESVLGAALDQSAPTQKGAGDEAG